MNKKILKVNIILMLIVMLLLLSGCNLNINKTQNVKQEKQQEQKTEDKIEYESYMLNIESPTILNEDGKIIVSSYKQLSELLNQNNMNPNTSEMLKQNLSKYDEEYFETKSLALVVAGATAGCSIELNETVKDENDLMVRYTVKDNRKEGYSYIAVMFYDLVVVEIDKDIQNIVVDVLYK